MKAFFATGLVFLFSGHVRAEGSAELRMVEDQARAYSVGAPCDCPTEPSVDQTLSNEQVPPSRNAQFLKHQADEFGKGRGAMPVKD